jgi:ribonuclease HI
VDVEMPKGMGAALLAFPFINRSHTLAVTCFNIAVWETVTHYASKTLWVRPASELRHKITLQAGHALSKALHPRTFDNENDIDLACDPPYDALTAFTDGSEIKETGQGGAGVFIRGWRGRPPENYSAPLGISSNNVGEIFALGLALTRLLQIYRTEGAKSEVRCLVFSDSRIALGVVTRGTRFNPHPELARAARKAYRELNALVRLEVRWIRGHKEVPGNVKADTNAKASARITTKGQESNRALINSPSRFRCL